MEIGLIPLSFLFFFFSSLLYFTFLLDTQLCSCHINFPF